MPVPLSRMAKRVPPGPHFNVPSRITHIRHYAKPTPQNIALDKNPDLVDGFPTKTYGRGIRKTSFRLPYLSNLKKMDPVFDDPYEVAAQTIRKTRKPGDPDIILDPDGIYDETELPDTDRPEEGSGVFNEAEMSKDYSEDQKDLPRSLHATSPAAKEAQKQDDLASLVAATGLSESYITGLSRHILVRKMVHNQLRMGKSRSVWVLMVMGDRNGMVGFGEGRAPEGDPSTAGRMAMIKAVQSLRPIIRYENRTIYGDVEGRVAATRVILQARPPGFGVRANYYVHEVCQCAGISDLSAKVRGSMNGMNVVKAVFDALENQKTPEQIARQRGMHVIDVRQRYFHGR
jgi:ribosomal protein S5